MLQATIANVNRGKGQRAYEADQFLPRWGRAEPKGPMGPEDMLRAVKNINKAMGGGGSERGNSRRPGDQVRDQ